MSSEETISDLKIDWTSDDDREVNWNSDDDREVDTRSNEVVNRSNDVSRHVSMEDPLIVASSSDDDREVDSRRVTVEDPSTAAAVNASALLAQGFVRVVRPVAEFPEYVEVNEPSTSGRPTGVLRNNPVSIVTTDSLSTIRTIYGIPDAVELRAPTGGERADWVVPGWSCFYEYTFRIGFRFPIPELVRRTLIYYDLAPGQLMPNTWRILLGISLLCERHNIQFGLGCLLHNYYMKQHPGDPGRYMLVPRRNKKEIILNTTTNDRHWKDTFFFARGPPVDGPWTTAVGEQYRCRQTWNRYGEHSAYC